MKSKQAVKTENHVIAADIVDEVETTPANAVISDCITPHAGASHPRFTCSTECNLKNCVARIGDERYCAESETFECKWQVPSEGNGK